MAGRRGRGSRPSTSMEEQLARPIDLNKRRSFQYVPAKLGGRRLKYPSGSVSPQASRTSPQFSSSLGRVGTLSPTLSYASTTQGHASTGSGGVSPSAASSSASFFARLGRRAVSSSAVATRKEQRRKQRKKRKKRKKRKHTKGSASSTSTLGDYSDSEADMHDSYDSFFGDEGDDNGGDGDAHHRDRGILGGLSDSRLDGGRRRRQRLRRGLSYARKLQQWQQEASHTYSSRHHVRFQRRLELPTTNISPGAVALLERSIFAHRNHPIIENMPVHPMPPVAVDSGGVGWNDTSPPTMIPAAASSSSASAATGWVSAVSSASSTRGNDGMVQSITFRQLSEPAAQRTQQPGQQQQQQQQQPGAVPGHGEDSMEEQEAQAEHAGAGNTDATTDEGDGAIPQQRKQQQQYQQQQQYDNHQNPIPPPHRPRSAWGDVSPQQSRSVRRQRSAQEVFSQLESRQGHNEDADTSVFVVDYRLSVLDRLRLLPSQMPARLEETRVTDVPRVEEGMTFFRKSAVQYVFGDLADDPGQRDDGDFAFDADAMRAVYDEDLAATSKPIGHAPLASVTEDVAMEEPAVVLRRSTRRSNAFDADDRSSRPSSMNGGDDRRLSVASVYGFTDMGESTDVDANQQALPRGNSISIPGLQGTADTDEPLPERDAQQDSDQDERTNTSGDGDAHANASEPQEMPTSPGSDHSESGFGFGFDELIDDLFFNKEKNAFSEATARAALAQRPRSVRLSRRLSSGASGERSPATSPHSGRRQKKEDQNTGDQRTRGSDSQEAPATTKEEEEGGGDGDDEEEATQDPARGYMSVFPEEEDEEDDSSSSDDNGHSEGAANTDADADMEVRSFKRRDTDVALGYGFSAPSKLDAIADAREDAVGEVTAGFGALLGVDGDNTNNIGPDDDDNSGTSWGRGGGGGGVQGKKRGQSIMRVTRNENHEAEMARLRESTHRAGRSGGGRGVQTAAPSQAKEEDDDEGKESPLSKEQEELMAKTVEDLGDADDQYEQLHYLKQLQELLRGDTRQIRECIDCAGVVLLLELARKEGYVAVQEAALDAMALIAAQRIGCLELSDSGCLSTLSSLLGALSVAGSAARVVVAIAKHMLDLVVLTGTLPKFVVVMPRFSKDLIKESIAMLHACRVDHAAALARYVPTDPLLTVLQDLRSSEDDAAALQLLEILHTIKQQQQPSAMESLTSSHARQALSPFKESTNDIARSLATELLSLSS